MVLPFGHLVEDLVAGPPHEVTVHELGHHPAAADGVAHRSSHDGRLGDGGVEEAMVGQAFGQAPVHAKGAAPIPILFAKGNYGGVFVETVDHGLEQRFGVGEAAQLGQGPAVLVQAKTAFGLQHLEPGFLLGQQYLRRALCHPVPHLVREHEFADGIALYADAGGYFVRNGRRQDAHQPFHDLFVVGIQLAFVGVAVLQQVAPKTLQRVLLQPEVDFFLGAVRGGVRRRMAGETVGNGIQQDRPSPFLQDLALALDGVGHGQWVIAVDPLRVHGLRVDAQAHPGQDFKAHGFTLGLATHAVEVVDKVEEHGRCPPDLRTPQGAILVHGRQHHGFPDRSTAHGGIADVGDHNAGAPIDALKEGGTRGNVGRTAHDGVVGHHAEGREKGVHGAAHPLIEALFPAENLGHGAV